MPKRFSDEGTLQPLDDPVDLTSRCTILVRDVRCASWSLPITVDLLEAVEILCACFVDGSEPGAGAEAEEWNESGSSTETESQGNELFWLDYQADCGTITSFLVYKVNAVFIICKYLSSSICGSVQN